MGSAASISWLVFCKSTTGKKLRLARDFSIKVFPRQCMEFTFPKLSDAPCDTNALTLKIGLAIL
jgi:hypothetical protein